MVYTSLAILALSASSALSPLANLAHHHDHMAAPDSRVAITLLNEGRTFQDVAINGKRYTVLPKEELRVKAPVGTAVIAASSAGKLHEGDVIVSLTPSLQNQVITIK